MSFLFKGSSSNSSTGPTSSIKRDDVPTPSRSPAPNTTSAVPVPSSVRLAAPQQVQYHDSVDRSGADSPSTRMPTFHTGSHSSSFSSATNSLLGGSGGLRTHQSASAPGTPPNELAVTRQSSVSSTSSGMSSFASGPGSMPMAVPLSSSSSGHASSGSSMHLPHSSLLMGKQLSSSGSLHNIYIANITMTPSSSLPSTPNTGSRFMEHMGQFGGPLPAELSLASNPAAQAMGMVPSQTQAQQGHGHTQGVSVLHAPVATMAGTAAVRSSPAGSPSSSPAPQQPVKMPSSVAASGHPPMAMSISPVGEEPSTAPPSDEVAQIRALLAGRALSRSIFTLGDTLGTGTFGRVRIVTYTHSGNMPAGASSASTSSSAALTAAATGKPLYFALKMLKKSEILRLKQVEHIKAEKAILSRIAHPFIVNLYAAFQDERHLYMTMEYVIGGELFSQLRKVGRFSNDTARFYAGEIVLALSYLHDKNIVYRDLKPENLLIDAEGHIKITDFGFAKVVEDRTWTLCGTPEYLAPEIIQSKGHNKAVDWWALGILIFEMLAGYPPFYDENPFGIYQKILKGAIEFPRHMDPHARDLVKKLLTADRTKRFGCLRDGAEDIRRHPWFAATKWDQLFARQVRPPFVPAYRAPNDTSNFDRYPDSRENPNQAPLGEKEKALFADF